MPTRSIALTILVAVFVLGCASTTLQSAHAGEPALAQSSQSAPRRCPPSRPGRRQPALGIRCY